LPAGFFNQPILGTCEPSNCFTWDLLLLGDFLRIGIPWDENHHENFHHLGEYVWGSNLRKSNFLIEIKKIEILSSL